MTTTTMPVLELIQLPNVLGVQWGEHNSTTRYQLFTLRPCATPRVYFAMSVDGVAWTSSAIVKPERFGAIPRTRREMLDYARSFITSPVKEG